MDKNLETLWEEFKDHIEAVTAEQEIQPLTEKEMMKLATITEICKIDETARILIGYIMDAYTIAQVTNRVAEFMEICRIAYQVGTGKISYSAVDSEGKEIPLGDLPLPLFTKKKGGDKDGEKDGDQGD